MAINAAWRLDAEEAAHKRADARGIDRQQSQSPVLRKSGGSGLPLDTKLYGACELRRLVVLAVSCTSAIRVALVTA